ncbi:MAG: hypothetical protein NTU86_00585 [Burkholderiales bacterium]|nr:hypothetical protein [Burkholderiales bacterium]
MKPEKHTGALIGRLLALATFAATLTACCAISAQPSEGSGGPRRPPAEALDACKTASSGQECSFTSPRGSVKGTCWAPEGKPLACKPKDAPAGSPSAPKQ